MMRIKKIKDGTLLVPMRAEAEGIIGDGIVEIKPDSPEYEKYLQMYLDEQKRRQRPVNNA